MIKVTSLDGWFVTVKLGMEDKLTPNVLIVKNQFLSDEFIPNITQILCNKL